MTRKGTGKREFFIYLLIYSSTLAYLQLLTVLVYGNSPPESQKKGYLIQNFSKNIEKYV